MTPVGDATRQTQGRAAEALAESFLIANGLQIVCRNWRSRRGEIDLVARDRDTLVFVEVRLRGRSDFGGAAASITATKRLRLVAAAEAYLARCTTPPPCRFDAILMDRVDVRSIHWMKDIIAT